MKFIVRKTTKNHVDETFLSIRNMIALLLLILISNSNSRITRKNISKFNNYINLQKTSPFSLSNIKMDQLISIKTSYTYIKTTTKTVTEIRSTEINVTKNCGIKSCPLVVYEYELSSEAGKFNLINSQGLNKLEFNESDKSKMKFSVDHNPINDLFDRFTFDYNCPFLTSLIYVKITAKPKFDKKRTGDEDIYPTPTPTRRRVNADNNFPITLSKYNLSGETTSNFYKKSVDKKIFSNFDDIKFDLSSLGNEPKILFDGYVDISLIFSKSQYLKATILSEEAGKYTPLANTEAIIKTINFPTCPELRIKSDSEGELNLQKLKVFDTLEKIKYSIEFVYPKYKKTIFEFNTGGFGYSEFIDLGKIILIREDVIKTLTYKGKIINSTTNQPEDRVRIRFLTLHQILQKSSRKPNFSEGFNFLEKRVKYGKRNFNLKKNSGFKESEIYSNAEGIFEINNLKAEVYFLHISKEGFYGGIVENIQLDEINSEITHMTVITPILKGDEMRFVLSWPNAPRDLDIYAFVKNPGSWRECEVNPHNRECEGIKLDVDNSKGGFSGVETITINKILPKIYTIAVHKYTPKGHARRTLSDEEITPKFIYDNIKINNYETLDNIPLRNSQAKITVYDKESFVPVKISKVPRDYKNNLLTKDDETKSDHDWWIVLCFDGRNNVFKNVDKLSAHDQDSEYCEKLFENSPNKYRHKRHS